MNKPNINLKREMTEAWVDSKTSKLFEFSSYVDEKGWTTQSIDRVRAREFVLSLIEEIQEKLDSVA